MLTAVPNPGTPPWEIPGWEPQPDDSASRDRRHSGLFPTQAGQE